VTSIAYFSNSPEHRLFDRNDADHRPRTPAAVVSCVVDAQLVPVNPPASVRGPKYVVKRGKTPVWSRDDTNPNIS